MAQETIDAIRQAELSAEQTVKNTSAQADAIILQAQKTARKATAAQIQEAEEKAGQALQSAQKQGAQIMDDAKRQAELEIESLRSSARVKQSQAAELVLSSLI